MRTVKVNLQKPKLITTQHENLEIDNADSYKKVIKYWVDTFVKENRDRYIMLQKYYDGYSMLQDEAQTVGDNVSDSTVISPYPQFLVDQAVDFYLSEDIVYSTLDEKDGKEDSKDSKRLLDAVKRCHNVNSAGKHDLELGTSAAIHGVAYELSYMGSIVQGDESSEKIPKTALLDPCSTFLVHDKTVEHRVLYAVLFEEPDTSVKAMTETHAAEKEPNTNGVVESGKGNITVYTQKEKLVFDWLEGGDLIFNKDESEALLIERLPVRVLRNDISNKGDFEIVLSAIEAYNQLQTTTLTDLEYLADAIFYVKGAQGNDDDDFRAIMVGRGLKLPPDGEAGYITKDTGNEASETMKKRTIQDIHKLSRIPDLTDEEFSGNDSGVAMGYKLIGLTSKTKRKIRYFTEMLKDRIAYIATWKGISESTLFDENKIDIDFKLNLPHNDVEAAALISQLSPWVSQKTLLALLSFINEPEKEMEAKAIEDEFETENEYQEFEQFESNEVLEAKSDRAGGANERDSLSNSSKDQ